MDINVNALNVFTAKFVNPASEQTDEDKRTLITDGHVSFSDYVSDKISRWANRSFSQPNATNLALKDVSSQFYQSVSAIFNGQIPQSVKDALGVHDLADGKMRPLSVRCIKRVKQAVDNLDSVKLARLSLKNLLDAFKNNSRMFEDPELDTIASVSEAYANQVAAYRQRMAEVDEILHVDTTEYIGGDDDNVDEVGSENDDKTQESDQKQLGTLEEAENDLKKLAPAVQHRIGIQRKMLEFFKAPEALVIRTLKNDAGNGPGSVNEFLKKKIKPMVENKINEALVELDALKESGKISAEELVYYKGQYDANYVGDQCKNTYATISNMFDAPGEIFDDELDVNTWIEQTLSESADEITKLAKDIQNPSENKDYSAAFDKITEELNHLLSPTGSLLSGYNLTKDELNVITNQMCDYRDKMLAGKRKEILTGKLQGDDFAQLVVNGCEKGDGFDAIPKLEDKVVEILKSVRTENVNKLLRDMAKKIIYSNVDNVITGWLNTNCDQVKMGGILLLSKDLPEVFANLPKLSREAIDKKVDELSKDAIESDIGFMGDQIDHYVQCGRFKDVGPNFSRALTGVAVNLRSYVENCVKQKTAETLSNGKTGHVATVISNNIKAIREHRKGDDKALDTRWAVVDKFLDNPFQPLTMGPSKTYPWLAKDQLTLAKGNVPLRKLLANFAENFYVKNGVFPGDQDFLDRIKVVSDRLEKVVLSAFDTLNTRMTIDKNASHMLKLSVYFKEGSKSRATFHNNLREQLMNVYALAMPEIDKYKDEDLQKLAKATFGAVFNGIDKDDLPTPPEKFSAIKDVFTEFDPKNYKK